MALKRVISGFKTVNEFLGDFAEAVKDTPWPDAIAKALPWLGILGEGIADTVAPIKFVLKLYESATRIDDPNELGEIACTSAFQRSVQQALTTDRLRTTALDNEVAAKAGGQLGTPGPSGDYDFAVMTLPTATAHPFYLDARQCLERFLGVIGIQESDRNLVLLDVDQRFAINLELLLTNRDTATKFEPFYRLLGIENAAQRANQALRKHAAYQRWMYEERRILREEPYALQHIYVRTDCGDLKWEDFEQRKKDRQAGKTSKPDINPFADHPDHGGRHDLLDTVFGHLADPNLRDLIVIQGPAGTGKSSLTLRLCHELLKKGLQPIRIELKHLDTAANRHVRDTLPEAVRLADEDFDPELNEFVYRQGLFQDDAIFAETATLEGTKICRYVLILDAWDEISVGAAEGYQQHIERLLKEIHDTYLDRSMRGHPVRVIMTGRPSESVTQGHLMRDQTRLLTLRYFNSGQLAEFHERLSAAVQSRPIRSPQWGEWTPPDPSALQAVRAKYEQSLTAAAQASAQGQTAAGDHGLELLGSPLLGLLSLRLLGQWPADPNALFGSRTLLYRSLVDLLLGGGKPPSEIEPGKTSHVIGSELRQLLWGTAEAMSVLGREAIPKAELLRRVRISTETADETIARLLDEKKLSRLLVSFFFHGGRAEQGCEFSHKSFREYLFAEGIVEELKAYGRKAKPLPERDVKEGYWRDFTKQDPRREFAHRMTRLLGPQWLTAEVGSHLAQLIEWEVRRASGQDPFPPVKNGEPTDPLPIDRWTLLRDTMADLWDWWGEGVHLRPQPYETDESPLKWDDPVALTVAKTDRMLSGSLAAIRPPRIITIDSHLGDALFQLCCDLHRSLIDYGGEAARGKSARRYQSVDHRGLIRFFPSSDGHYWGDYYYRIQAAGYRYRFRGDFPQTINLAQIDWRNEELYAYPLEGVNLEGAHLKGVNLERAHLRQANLERAQLQGANLEGANLEECRLEAANLRQTNLGGASLRGSNLKRSNLKGAWLLAACLEGADLEGANLRGAELEGADLTAAHLGGADLLGAKLQGSYLQGVDLQGVSMQGANLKGAHLQ